MLLVASLAFAFLAQAPAEAPPVQPPPREVEGVTVKAPEKDRLVCKSARPIGSKLPVKTCYKRSELDAQRAQAKEFADEITTKTDHFYKPPER